MMMRRGGSHTKPGALLKGAFTIRTWCAAPQNHRVYERGDLALPLAPSRVEWGSVVAARDLTRWAASDSG